jgi:hypothetical protein
MLYCESCADFKQETARASATTSFPIGAYLQRFTSNPGEYVSTVTDDSISQQLDLEFPSGVGSSSTSSSRCTYIITDWSGRHLPRSSFVYRGTSRQLIKQVVEATVAGIDPASSCFRGLFMHFFNTEETEGKSTCTEAAASATAI